VRVKAKRPTDSWSSERKNSVEIVAIRDNGQYQTIHLAAGEVVRLFNVIARASGHKLRELLAAELVRGMTDRQVLEVVAADLKTRLPVHPKRSPHNRHLCSTACSERR
jgi:hypothetical protein